MGALVSRWVPVSWLWTLWDLVIATVVAAVAVQYLAASVWDMLIGLGMAAALIARRHAPIAVFATVSALALLQLVVASAVPAGYDLALFVAMAAVVTHTRTLWPALVAGAVVTAGLATISVRDIVLYDDWALTPLTAVANLLTVWAACAALWLLAFVVRVGRDRAVTARRERAHLAMLAEADERAFIARELHDVVAHSLAVMIAQADGASYVVERNPAAAREAMRTVAGTGREALDDMHRIVAVLRGSTGTETGDDRRPHGLAELEALAARARTAGVGVVVKVEGETGALSAADELTVYRIVQESLTNVLRHAGPGAEAEVRLRVGDGRAELEIGDDGGGRPADVHAGGGNGLLGMRERLAVHGGEFSAGPRDPGPGWQIRAVLTIKGAA
jgi:signal transduction histidine kinase